MPLSRVARLLTPRACCCIAAAAQWNGRGLGDLVRFMLEFTLVPYDNAFVTDKAEFEALKASGKLAFGQGAPVSYPTRIASFFRTVNPTSSNPIQTLPIAPATRLTTPTTVRSGTFLK